MKTSVHFFFFSGEFTDQGVSKLLPMFLYHLFLLSFIETAKLICLHVVEFCFQTIKEKLSSDRETVTARLAHEA